MRLLYEGKSEKSIGSVINDKVRQNLIRDLELNKIARLLSPNCNPGKYSQWILDTMSSETKVISYRQEVSKVLFENENLFNDLYRIYNKLLGFRELFDDNVSGTNRELHNYLISLKSIALYCSIIDDFILFFMKFSDIQMPSALSKLSGYISNVHNEKEYRTIKKNLQKMNIENHSLGSVTLGINLNEYLEPVSMNCTEINDYYFKPKKLIDMGQNSNNTNGIGKLKYIPRSNRLKGDFRYDEMNNPTMLADTNRFQRFLVCEINNQYIKGLDSFFKVMDFNSRRPVKEYLKENCFELIEAIDDLGFYLNGASLAKQLSDRKMPVCLPTIKNVEFGCIKIDGLYNCLLPFIVDNALDNIVSNDIQIDPENSFSLVFGPNKGGKTILVQAVALNMILFQTGLYIAGKTAEMSPVPSILTHFQKEESGTACGRLEREAENLRNIILCAEPNSFIILNEPFVTTTPSEGIYLIADALAAMTEIGFRGLLVTHFFGLSKLLEQQKTVVNKYNISAMNSRNDSKRTYILNEGAGEGNSRALDILREYAPGLLNGDGPKEKHESVYRKN